MPPLGNSAIQPSQAALFNPSPNADVDATGPRKSRGTDAGETAQTGSGPIRSAGLHPTACSVIAGGFRVHLALPNGVTLPKTARDGQRKVRVARKISVALSPAGRLLLAGSGGFGGLGDILFGSTGPRGGRREGIVEAAAKSAARSAGSAMARQVLRGVLGSLLGGKK